MSKDFPYPCKEVNKSTLHAKIQFVRHRKRILISVERKIDEGYTENWWTLTVNIIRNTYEGWNFNSGNYLFTTDTKYIYVSKFYCPSL